MSFREQFGSYFYPSEILLSEQFNFGNRDTIMAGNNLPEDLFFLASLQHGWMFTRTGTPPVKNRFLRNYPVLVWSKRIADELAVSGNKNSIVSGAAWSHLLRACKIDPRSINLPKNESRKLLYFPNHSMPGVLASTEVDLDSLASKYSATEVTVCLFWMDFVNPDVQEYYSKFACRIVCVGFRGSSGFENPWAPIGGRSLFTCNLLALIHSHDIIGFASIMSPFWYSLSLRKRVFLGQDSEIWRIWTSSGYVEESISFTKENSDRKMGLPNFPLGEIIEPDQKLIEFALAEIGWDESEDFIRNIQGRGILKKSKLDLGSLEPLLHFCKNWIGE